MIEFTITVFLKNKTAANENQCIKNLKYNIFGKISEKNYSYEIFENFIEDELKSILPQDVYITGFKIEDIRNIEIEDEIRW